MSAAQDRDNAMGARFREDTAGHTMTIVKDDGLYRHLQFRKAEGGSEYWYSIYTTPGLLTIDGDMGTYVFARIQDMFEFFHTFAENGINPHYWSEKIRASSDVRAYDEQVFIRQVTDAFNEIKPDLEPEKAEELWLEIQRDVLTEGCNEHSAHQAITNYTPAGYKHGFFTDTWEWDLKEYTAQFLWCCWAIVNGIRDYKNHHAALAAEKAKEPVTR